MEEYDAIIVGGGHNGLVAGGYLGRSGLKVLILERRDSVGGPCGGVEYFPGFKGAITNSPGSLEPKIVRDLELRKFGLDFVQPNPSMVMPFPDGKHFVAWREKERVVEKLSEFSEADADAYYRFFDHLQDFARKLRCSVFEAPPPLPDLLAGLAEPGDQETFAKVMMGSLRDLLDEWFESDEVKALIGMLGVMHNQLGPSTPGSAYMLLQRPLSIASRGVDRGYDPRLQPLRGSTGLPIGGMGAITNAMARSAESVGVEIRTNATVDRILVDDAGVAGVRLASGEVVRTQIVLSNLNPRTTFLDLVEEGALPPAFTQRVRNLRMTGSAFKVGLALSGLPRFAFARDADEALSFASCQFRIGPSLEYLERAYDDCKEGRWSRGPVIWGLTPSVTDPDLAPPGKHVMSLNVFHAPHKLARGDWSSERELFGNHCIDVLSQYVPNLPDIILEKRFWSPEDLENEYGLLEGNISHGDMIPSRMFSMRPLVGASDYATPVTGLYLCGSGAWPGGLVSGLPGHNASAKVLSDLSFGAEDPPLGASAN